MCCGRACPSEPLDCREVLDKDKVAHLGVRMQEHGPRLSVLEAQVEQGFAFVSEGACTQLLHTKKKLAPMPEVDEDWKTRLTMACIAAIKPDLSQEEVSAKINAAYLLEHPDCYGNQVVDYDLLGDVLDKREAEKMMQYQIGVEKEYVRKELVMETRDKYVSKLFKRKAPKPAWTKAQKDGPRWLPEQDTKATTEIREWIMKFCGPDVQVQKDDFNGRWRVIAPTKEWKSISWTMRGHEKAAMEAIHMSWKYQADWNGMKSPFDLDTIAGKFMV